MTRLLKIGVLIFAIISLVLPIALFEVYSQELSPEAIPPFKEEPETPPPPKRIDADRNRIFDDLESRLSVAKEGDIFPVIVLLRGELTILPELKSRHGDFVEDFTYPAINGFVAKIQKGKVLALAQDPAVQSIEYDDFVKPHLDTSQQWFGSAKAKTDFSVDGNADGLASYSKNDIVIAILDTGIDPGHVDLDSGKIIAWRDATINNNQAGPYDETGPCSGHGTHVSSISAGEGQADPILAGVAPGAALVGIKVLSERVVQGQLTCTATISEILSGAQWMIDNKVNYGIRIGNMSLGASGCSNGTDSLSTIVNAASDAGIVMTVSAGNEGPGPCTIGSPGAAEKAITVGAMADVAPGASFLNACGDNDLPDAGFYLACFSSRGKTADARIKPDISAPGVFIKAAKAGTANSYVVLSGTSMSSPFVAGVAALLFDANPGLTPLTLKNNLETTSLDWGPQGKDVDYGSGRLQAYEAVKAAGAFSGVGPSVPDHSFSQDSLSPTNTEDLWDLSVTDPSLPLAITMIMSDWVRATNPDFDMELRDPSGTLVAKSISATRQETIGIKPVASGIYQLRVYRYRGSGPYFFDVSIGKAAVAISLTTDGTTPFGVLELGGIKDTTSLGTNDPQTIMVDAGPANLDIRTTSFSDGVTAWALGATNGPNTAKWEFSKDGLSWTTFAAQDTLYSLSTNLAAGSTQTIYFRLTMPTESSSYNQFNASVTIVATSP